MKELTIEEKAKAYDEVVNKLKGFMAQGVDPLITRADVQDFFPELKESEDEQIRQRIIHALHGDVLEMSEIKEAVAWLERQKEFVSADFDDVWETVDCNKLTAPLDKYSKDAIKEMCHAWYDKGIELERRNWLEKQGEKNTWKPSEEHIHGLIWVINRMPDLKNANEAEAVLRDLLEQLNKLRKG